LRGRTARCNYNGIISKLRNVKSGFPQGSVLSPDLWNAFTSNCPDTAEVTAAYADDLYELETDTDLVVLGVKLQRSADAAAVWSKKKNLVIAPAKS
jgi:hypothetical protein